MRVNGVLPEEGEGERGGGGGDLAAGRGICNCMVWPSGKLSLICQLTSEDIKQHFT